MEIEAICAPMSFSLVSNVTLGAVTTPTGHTAPSTITAYSTTPLKIAADSYCDLPAGITITNASGASTYNSGDGTFTLSNPTDDVAI